MNAEDEAKLLRHLQSLDRQLEDNHDCNARVHAEILTHLDRINSTLESIDRNLMLLEMEK